MKKLSTGYPQDVSRETLEDSLEALWHGVTGEDNRLTSCFIKAVEGAKSEMKFREFYEYATGEYRE